MTKQQARLQHLAVRLDAMYGPEDPDVIEVKKQSMALDEAAASGKPLRYDNLPMFEDRSARLARIPNHSR